tara:strand:+ start:1711 stop:1836 length:126 start_codon:yes stop_codon:yes gene_type:complete
MDEQLNTLLTQLLKLNKKQLRAVDLEVRVALMEMEMGAEDE